VNKMTKKFVGWIESDHRIYKVVHCKDHVRLHELISISQVPYRDYSNRVRYECEGKKEYIKATEDQLCGECDLSNCGAYPIWSTLTYNNSFRHYYMRKKHLTRSLITGKVIAV
jgi:hypothetical protein